MTEILVCIAIGIIIGWLDILHYQVKKILNHLATAALFLMLWCLGAKIGCDSELLAQLATLGGKSVIMALFVIAGSVAMLWLVTKIFAQVIEEEIKGGEE